MTLKIFFSQLLICVSKIEEFEADFNSVEKSVKSSHKNSIRIKVQKSLFLLCTKKNKSKISLMNMSVALPELSVTLSFAQFAQEEAFALVNPQPALETNTIEQL
jgi:hypothetical protein